MPGSELIGGEVVSCGEFVGGGNRRVECLGHAPLSKRLILNSLLWTQIYAALNVNEKIVGLNSPTLINSNDKN